MLPVSYVNGLKYLISQFYIGTLIMMYIEMSLETSSQNKNNNYLIIISITIRVYYQMCNVLINKEMGKFTIFNAFDFHYAVCYSLMTSVDTGRLTL